MFNIHNYSTTSTRSTGWTPITFDESEEDALQQPHEDPFLITARVGQYNMSRILVDGGSAVNVLFHAAYKQLECHNAKLIKDHEPLLSFSGDITQPLGSDTISLVLGTHPKCAQLDTEFIVVDCPSSYNAILGRPALCRLKCIIAYHMLLMKLPTPEGTMTIRGDQEVARQCYATTVSRGRGRTEILSLGPRPSPFDIPDDPRGKT